MIKRLILILTLCFSMSAIAQDSLSQVDVHGRLQVSGAKILSEKHGNPVQLRGMSMFWSQWSEGSKYYRASIVDELVDDWKVNVLRASMGIDEGTVGYLHNPSAEKQKITTLVDACIDRGIYVIIDWHSHYAEEQEEEAKAFFAEMAQKYGEYPNVIYEIYNEPTTQTWAGVIKPYCEAVIDTIRKYDPDNLIICGTRTWSQRVDEVANNKIDDPNVAYTLHFYSASHGQSLRNIAQTAINNGVPIFVTEFGTCEASGAGRIDFDETNVWWDFLEKNDISWCNWSISDKAEAASALVRNSSIFGNWTDVNYTTSGAFVRDKLRGTYVLPEYLNDMSIEVKSGFELLYTDRNYMFDLNTYNADTLLPKDSITYFFEVSDGGSITSEGVFIPNGESGSFKLFITAKYDTLITTKTIEFAVTDVIPTELENTSDKTYLALSNSSTYKLGLDLIYPVAIDTITPVENDLLNINDKEYSWQVVNETGGAFSVADSAVKSYLAIYITNPIAREARIKVTQVGTSKVYINGKSASATVFQLLKGENLLTIEFKGTTDSSYFDFLITDVNGDTLPYLSYTTSGNGSFDCSKTFKGSAFVAECGCIGGNTGIAHCPGPFNGEPAAIPGRIQAQEYDWGQSGSTHLDKTPGNNGDSDLRTPDDVDISSTNDQNGVASIGWIDSGEWLKYTVDVKNSGNYVVDFRVSSGLSGSLQLKLDNKNLFAQDVTIANTGGWNTWKTVTSDTIYIAAGIHAVRFESTGGAFNINYMDFIEAKSLGINDLEVQNVQLFPNPFEENLIIETDTKTDYTIYNQQGIVLEIGNCTNSCSVGLDLPKGVYLIELKQENRRSVQRLLRQ